MAPRKVGRKRKAPQVAKGLTTVWWSLHPSPNPNPTKPYYPIKPYYPTQPCCSTKPYYPIQPYCPIPAGISECPQTVKDMLGASQQKVKCTARHRFLQDRFIFLVVVW
ncbi:hypothetical protein EYF80_062347 [Liparis tanakae]|uniref:Uncharacterized protein n=1 Tax=Liparis tanakae TaxID=230148 RepID=A0A4Z2EF51_9TELE|nr:hypothetical protein EYF80_062347 [Liparis tanakae]